MPCGAVPGKMNFPTGRTARIMCHGDSCRAYKHKVNVDGSTVSRLFVRVQKVGSKENSEV